MLNGLLTFVACNIFSSIFVDVERSVSVKHGQFWHHSDPERQKVGNEMVELVFCVEAGQDEPTIGVKTTRVLKCETGDEVSMHGKGLHGHTSMYHTPMMTTHPCTTHP